MHVDLENLRDRAQALAAGLRAVADRKAINIRDPQADALAALAQIVAEIPALIADAEARCASRRPRLTDLV